MTTPKPKQFLIDTPSLYWDVDTTTIDSVVLPDKFLGLSKGGIKLDVIPNIRKIEFDGRLEKEVMGLDRVTKWDCKAEGSIVEFNRKILQASLLKQDSTATSTKYDCFVPSANIENSDYKTLLIVGTLHGTDTPIMVELNNTYNSEGFNFEGKDNDESACKMAFAGHYDSQKMNVAPCKVWIGKEQVV